MILRALTHDDLPKILDWRAQCPEALRTSRELTLENQEEWYARETINRESRSRWWGIWIDCEDLQPEEECLHFRGYCAIENIQWENRLGEISLLIDPQYAGKSYGSQAVEMLLEKGFNQLNLENIFGECYYCAKSMGFWDKIIKKYPCQIARLPNRKYWNGQYWDALYFNFNREDWRRSFESDNS